MASALYVDDIYLGGKGGMPIGAVYVQLPDTPDPSELFTGTWENVSSTYAGDFLRAEGGDASAFESGEQLDQMQRLTGEVSRKSDAGFVNVAAGGTAEGAFVLGDEQVDGINVSTANAYNIGFDSASSPDARTSATTDGETRPVNRTVRVWKRTA